MQKQFVSISADVFKFSISLFVISGHGWPPRDRDASYLHVPICIRLIFKATPAHDPALVSHILFGPLLLFAPNKKKHKQYRSIVIVHFETNQLSHQPPTTFGWYEYSDSGEQQHNHYDWSRAHPRRNHLRRDLNIFIIYFTYVLPLAGIMDCIAFRGGQWARWTDSGGGSGWRGAVEGVTIGRVTKRNTNACCNRECWSTCGLWFSTITKVLNGRCMWLARCNNSASTNITVAPATTTARSLFSFQFLFETIVLRDERYQSGSDFNCGLFGNASNAWRARSLTILCQFIKQFSRNFFRFGCEHTLRLTETKEKTFLVGNQPW